MHKTYLLLIALLLSSLGAWAQNEQVLSGTVQADSGMPLPGATVFIKGTYVGSSTNEEGQFEIRKANFANPPITLVVSFVGYETQELSLSQPDNAISVVLKPSAMLDQVVVAASRVAESISQVPVTVEKISQRQVQSLTSPDVIAGLNRFKSVDISSSSMLITSFSTRGFNSSRAERVLQLADYMDTQLPSLSSNFGNLLGIPILDVESMEILHGPASALYGANAFNGVLLFNSKDPFTSPGLTVRLRAGNRSFYNGELRYAQKIGDKFAFKISGGYLTADEFIADNQEATNPLVSEANNNAAGSPLNYDAVNRYGDVNTGYTFPTVLVNPATGQPYRYPTGHPQAGQPIPTPASLVGKSLFLPGYAERDLLADDTKAYSLKVAPSISYLLTNSIKLTADYKYTLSNAIYQNVARYRFKDSGAHQGRIEVKGENWFVRAYSTRDFSGGRDPQTDGAYNLGLLGAQMANQPVSPTGAGPTYAQTYVGTYLGTLAQTAVLTGTASPTTAQQNAGAVLLQPGTDAFNNTRDKLIHTASLSEAGVAQGSRVVLRSFMNDASAQYTFKNTFADLTLGGAYRQFLLASDRTVFDDPISGEYIQNYEYGGYAQAAKSLLDDHLRVSGAVRVDNFKNFGTAVSPRGSLVYSLGGDKQHNFRVSYSRAFRSPTQSDQYVRFDVGRVILIGNVGNGFQGYSPAIRTAANPTDASLQINIDKLRLEEVNTVEGGYRTQLTKSLYADINYYYNTYNDFIGNQTFIGNIDGTRPTLPQLATVNAPGSSVRVIQVSTNVQQEVKTQGASIGLTYNMNDGLTITTNYSYNDFITKDLPANFLTFFNTPTKEFNFGIDGRLLKRKLSYNVNYRWSDKFTYESTFAVGEIPSIQLVDAQVGYTFGKYTTLQAGVSNLFDAKNTQVYGASNIGRMGFFGLLFDIK